MKSPAQSLTETPAGSSNNKQLAPKKIELKMGCGSCQRIVAFFCLGIALQVARGQTAPANDDYADRTVVVGSSVTVTGVMAGATWEFPGEPESGRFYNHPNGSLWWSWTPAESTPVVLWAHRLKRSSKTFYDAVSVWTNLCDAPFDGGYLIDCPGVGRAHLLFDAGLIPFGAIAFWAQGGVPHDIQLEATSDAEYAIHWEASTAPVILQQPVGRNVAPGDSTLFKVMAMGLPPLQYQWTFQGADLPGQTAPMLALDDIQSEDAGDYGVRVTSATGSAQSDTVALTVAASADAPRLEFARLSGTNEFQFQLLAVPGRSYRIESSTNLGFWVSEASFPIGVNLATSVVIPANPTHLLRVPRDQSRKYVRAAEYVPPNRECINHLKQVRFAKDMWVLETKSVTTDTPADRDLLPYWIMQKKPTCPEGAYYFYGSNEAWPKCSVAGHVFEEPRFP